MKKIKSLLLFFVCGLVACAMAIPLAACNQTGGGGGGGDGSSEDNRVLQSITVDSFDAKVNFAVGEEFSYEGLTVTANYLVLGESITTATEDVTSKVDYDTSEFDSSKAGTYTVYLSYTYDTVTMYGDYNVNVLSDLEGTIAGLEVTYDGARQIDLTAENPTATIDLTKIKVTRMSGDTVDDVGETILPEGNYTLSYSKDGGALTAVEAGATSLSGLTKGVYSIYALSTYTLGNETFEMSGFVTVFVVDSLASIAKDEGGTLTYDYGADVNTIGSDWTFTATYGSGATVKLNAEDVDFGERVNDSEGENSVTVSYTEEVLKYDAEADDAVTDSVTVDCDVTYTIGENPNAGTTYEKTTTVNITELGIANSDSITESIDLSGDGKIMAMASSSKEIRINDNSKKIDGFEFGRRLQLRGAGTADERSIKLTVEGPAEIIVYGMSATSNSVRTLSLYDGEFANPSQGQSNDGNAIQKFTYTVDEAGTYYLAGDNGMNIYYISIVETISAPVLSNVIVNITDLGIANSDSITESIDLSGDGKIMAMASSSKEIRINDNSKKIDGFEFGRRLQLRGAGTADERSIKLTVEGPAEIIVYGMSATSNSVRTLTLYDSNFANPSQGQSNDGNAIQKFTYTVDEAGTYYLAGDNGMNIYYIAITY